MEYNASHSAHEVLRVGGDMEVVAEFNAQRGEWRSGGSVIDTPLPEGYPAPTPPGAIEIKTYPEVRRAEISGTGSRSGSGFMPLFRHIQRSDIAMTSPVEMDYALAGDSNTPTTNEWTMSFLYRTQNLRETGVDEMDDRITIRDVEPLTVVSLGGRGTYRNDRIESDLATLMGWLENQSDWELAGAPRALLYNGPTWRPWQKWLEVQLPIRSVVDEDQESQSPDTSPGG
ncbi:MAG: heme-binding protein [Candidatus Sumerlaeia bacterium]|nr:heme-binding protein [Candidatus Sumerlaeia bacterium]